MRNQECGINMIYFAFAQGGHLIASRSLKLHIYVGLTICSLKHVVCECMLHRCVNESLGRFRDRLNKRMIAQQP